MRALSQKQVTVIALALIILGAGVFAFSMLYNQRVQSIAEEEMHAGDPRYETVGTSVEGRTIDSYTYGNGPTHLLFVGGVHGGYEYNSTLLAYAFIDFLEEDSARIPEGITVSVIPSANPDGLYAVVGKEGRFTVADVPEDLPAEASAQAGTTEGQGRFNANEVDLNRNFDCKWQAESKWRGHTVSAGTQAFSEPEARAIRDFVLKNKPSAVIFWHSQSNAVYASECEDGILPGTLAIMNAYADVTGYPAVDSFDAYEITGDAEGWLASIGIPAITVELKTHETIEWEKNLKGIKAVFEYFGQ